MDSQPEDLADDIIELQHNYRDPDTSFPDKIRLMKLRSAEKSKLL